MMFMLPRIICWIFSLSCNEHKAAVAAAADSSSSRQQQQQTAAASNSDVWEGSLLSNSKYVHCKSAAGTV
jgi:hypothetical protein